MAVTMTTLTSGGDTANLTSYPTASITPTANRLVLAAIVNSKAATPPTPTLAGCGLTWVEIATIGLHTNAAPTRRVTLFRAMGASPTAEAVTISADGTGCAWSIAEFAGVDTTGTNGSGAVVQSATAFTDSGSGLTVTLGAFGSAGNATYGAFATSDAGGAGTVGTGFTKIHPTTTETTYITPNASLLTEWRNDNDTTVDFTNAAGTTNNNAGIAIEIKESSAAATPHHAGANLGVWLPVTGPVQYGTEGT